jgi:hypothetical protein
MAVAAAGGLAVEGSVGWCNELKLIVLKSTYGNVNMTERRNTIVCVFESNAPKLSAYEVHEWISGVLRIPEEEALYVQIDGQLRKVFIKMADRAVVTRVLQATSLF